MKSTMREKQLQGESLGAVLIDEVLAAEESAWRAFEGMTHFPGAAFVVASEDGEGFHGGTLGDKGTLVVLLAAYLEKYPELVPVVRLATRRAEEALVSGIGAFGRTQP